MRVAILHFHLHTGGVTTVIRHQVEALAPRHRVVLLTGERPAQPWPVPVEVIPGVAYDDRPGAGAPAAATVKAILDAVARRLSGACDLLHVHNPTLAKNRRLLEVLRGLQAAGLPLFLQVHDLAEDGRPGAYCAAEPYPADCHYAVLNQRDFEALQSAGLGPEGLHLLPNAVTPLPAAPDTPPSEAVLYPVRAIRRKNIGEALLASLFWPPASFLDVTLPPQSPADVVAYRGWKAFARRRRLRAVFESGRSRPLDQALAASRTVLTTSIAEGFGFVFLEPWTAGRLLWGRSLPYLCGSLTAAGMRLDHLYRGVRVPLAWVGRDDLRRALAAAWEKSLSCYGRPAPPGAAEAFLAPLDHWDHVDFGLLDEVRQQRVIDLLLEHPRKREVLQELNPVFIRAGREPDAAARVAANRRIVTRRFTLEAYADRLEEVYTQVRDRPVAQCLDKERLLETFLNLEDFSLLKWGAPGP